jgi:AcrR family transcriptional regulator
MVARAKSTAATGERILDAATEVFWELPGERISLDEVARRAGVSTQTVIRRFGGRDDLLAVASEREMDRVRNQRDQAPTGDPEAAVRVLVDHYEAFGDRALKLLAEEERLPRIAELAARGRTYHREWCARVFAPALDRLAGVARRRRLAQIVAVCDVYMWQLLRRESRLSRRQTERALVELLQPLSGAG